MKIQALKQTQGKKLEKLSFNSNNERWIKIDQIEKKTSGSGFKNIGPFIKQLKIWIKDFKSYKENKDKDTSLPPITDDFVKQFGSFKNVTEFRVEIKHQLEHEKETGVKETKREEIVKKIMESSKMKIPALLVDEEFYDFIERRDEELKRAEMSLEEYLKEIKKTEKEFEQEERKLIEDRIKMSLVLGEIRKKENIEANEDEIRKYIPSLKMRYPNRSEEDLRQTTEAYITQEKLFELLEGKEKDKEKEKE